MHQVRRLLLLPPPRYRPAAFLSSKAATAPATAAPPSVCWSCKTSLARGELMCKDCKVVVLPAHDGKMTYFDLLVRSDQSFDVALDDVRRRYIELQQALHPDRFVHKDDAERHRAHTASSLVSKAYNTLKDPLERATYLLHLHGVDLTDESIKHELDPELLLEVMEERERLAEAEEGEQLKAIAEENQARMDTTLDDISIAFKNSDIVAARDAIIRLKYWSSLHHALEERQASSM